MLNKVQVNFFRKQRRAKPDLHPDNSSSSRDSTKGLRNLFPLSKPQSNTSTNLDDRAKGDRGPLGLSLLYSPSAPEIDLIFVHGLGGNSRKTWSKSSAGRSQFWPEEWLSKDPAFRNVRLHSYGYDSYYLKGKEDCLNVHHIGKSFLGAISTSPCIVNSRTYIVVVGHSMGGLVMKKAYILAKQDTGHEALAGRFAAFYFLATPHRGANSAKMLKNLLRVAYDRAYVGDLEPNSEAVQVTNDEFRHFSADLELWSFYETQNMKLFSSLIVDPESAVLGYRGEKQIPMTADHRSICKFDTPQDPNYILLRDALASTVSKIATAIPEKKRERTKNLKKYLEVSDLLDDDLANVCESRMRGSCEWISYKASYAGWKDGEYGNDRTLWIKGKPATGKSVLAGYVIDQLKGSGQACSYFFFKHGDKSKANLGRCLRCLAFQMAISNAEASDAILKMQADGICFNGVDERTLWRILFLSGIFQAAMTRHYWVIDALDECSNPPVLLNAILSNMDESIPLRILVTSRDTVELDQGFSAIPPNLVQFLPISVTDTKSDLRLLIERRTQALGVVKPNDRGKLAEKILDKSKGSFLWTILVLEELLRCHSRKEIHQILEDVPRGMGSLYKRTLDYMSQVTRGKELTKTILMWAACAVRPISISELDGALTLDIHDSFPNLEESIAALCGQLVVVDKYGRVNMVHETAREFLVAGGLESEFSIEKTKAHTRMAEVCLSYLVGEEMKPPRTKRRRSSANLPTRLDFAIYAYTAYSYHLSKADPLATEAFQLVTRFLKSNVLTWIETIADSQNLTHLIRASKHLKTYVDRCAVERSPLDPQMRALRQWSTDLARIPAMFANVLTVSPSAIYSLIPPFCPTESMVYKTGGSNQRLAVLGTYNKQWDDRMLCIDFHQGQPRALRYGDEFLAVALSSGAVVLYHATSYQEYKVLKHGEAVNFIAFKTKTDLVATCGIKTTKIWDIRKGQVVDSLMSPPRPLGMEFDGDMLLIASRNNYIETWNLGHDAQAESVRRPWSGANTPDTNQMPLRGTPCALTLSTSHGMLAVAYSGQPITLWDMEEDTYAGKCGKKLSSGETCTHVVVALAFNPNPDINLLAVAYLDGDLTLLDPYTDRQLECFRANCQTLSPSPNGRFLAAGGANGIVHVYEFDTFKLLYRVKSSNSYIKQLAFARDSMLLADIRGTQCTVWKPEALLRESLGDDSSGLTSTTVVETVSMEAKAKITAMVVHHTFAVVFCGKDDGSVVLYERKTAASLGILYRHKSPVRLLAWIEPRDALLSVDASNRIFLHRIQKSADKGWLSDPTVLFKSHLDSEKAITDVLVGEIAAKFLVSTRESDYLFNLDNGKYEIERTYPQVPGTRKWLPHPQSSLHLICVDNVKACAYCWSDWSEVSSIAFSLDSHTVELKSAILYSLDQKQRVMLHLIHPSSSVNINRITIIDVDCLAVEGNDDLLRKQIDAAATLDQLATDEDREDTVKASNLAAPLGSRVTTFELSVTHVLGVDESKKLIFLNRSFWVCSVDLSESRLEIAQRKDSPAIEVFEHFFVPYDWFAGKRNIVCALAKRDIMLTRGGDLAVIRGGIDYAERALVTDQLKEFADKSVTISNEDFLYRGSHAGGSRFPTALAAHLNEYLTPSSPITPDMIRCVGAATAMHDILAWGVADPGDGVLTSRPVYGRFELDFGNKSQAKVVYSDNKTEEAFQDGIIDHFEEALLRSSEAGIHVKMVLIVNPHNPLGRCYPKSTLVKIMQFCQKHRLHLLSDEIYACSVFNSDEPATPFTSILSIDSTNLIDPDLLHVTYGLSKDFGAAGLRLGAIITRSQPVLRAIEAAMRFHNPSGASLAIGNAMLEDRVWCRSFVDSSRSKLSQAHRHVTSQLKAMNIKYLPGSNAGFFVWIDLSPYLPSELDGELNQEFALAKRLREAGVFLHPREEHSLEPGWFRIVYTQDPRTVTEGLQSSQGQNGNIVGWTLEKRSTILAVNKVKEREGFYE
ncbi:unnamed protein product [Fusarium graminearum]|nr:unnamed protein product [Fusarium graminearum]